MPPVYLAGWSTTRGQPCCRTSPPPLTHHEGEEALALRRVGRDEKRNDYKAQDVGVLILVRVVDQHVRPKLMELAAAQPDLAVDLLLGGLPVLLLGVKVSGRPEEGLVGVEEQRDHARLMRQGR